MRSATLALFTFILLRSLWAAGTESPPEATGAPSVTPEGRPSSNAADASKSERKRPPYLREALSADALAELEKKIDESPGDLDLRATALQHYSRVFFTGSARDRQGRQRHVSWLITNAPESELAGSADARADSHMEPQFYVQARDLWRQQARTHAKDARVLGNAAQFFLLPEREQALSYLKEAAALEPENAHWAERIAFLHSLDAKPSRSEDFKAAAKAALDSYERAMTLTPQEARRVQLLPKVASMALASGDHEKAASYAHELVKLADAATRPGGDREVALHEGHRILGHVALAAGDVESAKTHLLASGNVAGAPTLNSFGPELTLANDLLKKGERDAVVQYLTSIRRFWKYREDGIDDLVLLIRTGKTPELDRREVRRSEAPSEKN